MPPIGSNDRQKTVKQIWDEYSKIQKQNADNLRHAEHQSCVVTYSGIKFRYHISSHGESPVGGYPVYIALHGGGGFPESVNDRQWEGMQSYYVLENTPGIYVAPRGITNTWDMHFRPESYVFYDRMIENLLLFENINPDRVYLVGFSAGGDGVYQIAPRMADRFAAANMSAGHSNSVKLRNLFDVPIALQVGQFDEAYNRNSTTVQVNAALDDLREENPGRYVHQLWVHSRKGHNFFDNHRLEEPQAVLGNPEAELADGDADTLMCNTHAIRWLQQFTRNPRPDKVIWDLTTRGDRKGDGLWSRSDHGQQHYWLDIGKHTAATLGVAELIVVLDRKRNTLRIEKAKTYLRLLVDTEMLDFDKPVTIEVGGQTHTVNVQYSLDVQKETVAQRGDPRYIFDASITLVQTLDGWELTS